MIIHQVEQGTPEWTEVRRGTPSASCFKNILTATGKPSTSRDKYALALAREVIYGVEPLPVNPDMQRGLDLESEAVRNYEFEHGVKTQVVGWVTNDDNTYGCSPDRMNLEVKCPRDNNHTKWSEKGCVPSEHFCQVQGCMWVCEQDYWDFYSYSETLGSFCFRAYRDEEWISAMEKEMSLFLERKSELLELLKEEAA
jgi:hypothetical protein